MPRLRDTFANQVWLRSVAGDRERGRVTIIPDQAGTVRDMLDFLMRVPCLAVVFDSVGGCYSVRVVKSTGMHGDSLDLPAASYLGQKIDHAVEAAYRDYMAICGGATWTASGGKEHIRGVHIVNSGSVVTRSRRTGRKLPDSSGTSFALPGADI